MERHGNVCCISERLAPERVRQARVAAQVSEGTGACRVPPPLDLPGCPPAQPGAAAFHTHRPCSRHPPSLAEDKTLPAEPT